MRLMGANGQTAQGLDKAAFEALPVAGLLMSLSPWDRQQEWRCGSRKPRLNQCDPKSVSTHSGTWFLCLSKDIAGLCEFPRRWAGGGMLWVTMLW